jgi:adenylate cyclase
MGDVGSFGAWWGRRGDTFQGDGALCVFGAPVSRERLRPDALGAARELRLRVSDEVPQGFGIGVSAVRAVAGNVGTEEPSSTR